MECPRCGRAAEPDQNFCNGCGVRLRTDPDRGSVDDQLSGTLSWLDDADTTGEVAVVAADETGEVDDVVGIDDNIESTGEVTIVAPIDDAAETGEVPAVVLGDDVGSESTPDSHTTDDHDVTSDHDVTRPKALVVPFGSIETVPDHAVGDPDASADPATSVVPAQATVVAPALPRSTAVIPAVESPPPATEMVPQTAYGRLVGGRRFHLTATSTLGFAVAILAVAVLFLPLLSVQSSVTVLLDNAAVPDGFRFGSWTVGSLGSNLPMAVLICATLAAIGAVATGYGKAWGAGLVAGASLSFVGIAALAVGLLEFPIEAAYAFARIPTEVPIGLRITREPGYWLMLTTGGVAVVATFSSIKECMNDRRRNLNPWFAAFGALSVLLLVIGAMIPINGAIISDNWFVIEGPGEAPQTLVAGRMVQLGLLFLAGTAGFLLVRSYGLGLAVGGTLPSLWLGLSVLLNGANPVGPGWRNPGATKMDVHPVTIIEMAAVLALLVLASLSAYGQQGQEAR